MRDASMSRQTIGAYLRLCLKLTKKELMQQRVKVSIDCYESKDNNNNNNVYLANFYTDLAKILR